MNGLNINPVTNMPISAEDFQLKIQQRQALAGGQTNADKLREAAKQFEGALTNILMKEMEKTIGDSGLFEDGQSKQIKGMFWQFMSQEISNQGGIGLADQLYKQFSQLAGVEPADK